MPPSPLEQLLLSISVLGVSLLFGGAPLSLALPGGALVWFVGRGRAAFWSRFAALLSVLIALYPLYIALIQISYWRAGRQGVDFGIFSQVIYQVARSDRFVTSLLGTDWQNFITHHFSPYLFALGGVVKLGVSPELTLIGAQVVAVAFLAWGLRGVWASGGTSTQALVLTSTALLLPGVRRALGWETHDEVLALPFLVWSLVAHLRGRDTLRLLLLFPPLLFKETFGLVMLVTSLAYAIDSSGGTSGEGKSPKRLAFLVAVFGGVFFVVVTRVLPGWLWVSTFDPSTRIASWGELVDGELVSLKVRWIALVFGPLVPFLFLHTARSLRISAVLIAPALFNIGAILITNFPSMIEPQNYYSVTPSVLALVAFSYPVLNHPRFSPSMLLVGALAITCGVTVRSSKIVKAGFSRPSAYAELRGLIPPQAVVIADDYTTSVLADSSYVMRTFHAQTNRPAFDYIVVQRSMPDEISTTLRNRAKPCHETPRYIIWCSAEDLLGAARDRLQKAP